MVLTYQVLSFRISPISDPRSDSFDHPLETRPLACLLYFSAAQTFGLY